MTLASLIKISKEAVATGYCYIIYDANQMDKPAAKLFDADYHIKQQSGQNNLENTGVGRAPVVYFKYKSSQETTSMVLKHYYRGGLIAKITKDKYFAINNEQTRAFKEWRLLNKMQTLQLPAPKPIAAKIQRQGFFYTADLITEEILNSKTLADVLLKNAQAKKEVNEKLFFKVGEVIALFHGQNIYHADLNARNILISNNKVYLIDFDSSGFKKDSLRWKQANLARLKRSLEKFKKNESQFYFNETDWQKLLQGYKAKLSLTSD